MRKSFAQAQGDIIYLMDADCVTDDACFEAALRPFWRAKRKRWPGHGSRCQRREPRWSISSGHTTFTGTCTSPHTTCFDGRNAMFRRAAWRSGAFDVDTPIGTDYVQSKQLVAADVPLQALPQSRIQTVYPASFAAYWRQQSRWFRSPLILGLQHKAWGQVLTQLRAGISALFLLAIPPLGGLRIDRCAAFGCWPWRTFC
ncbi:MAG: glycosyltransferase [Caldilineaceae bacterium]